MKYTTSEIASILNSHVIGDKNYKITSITTDSRTSDGVDGSMFVAISGPNRNGHSFIGDLYAQNVRCFLVDKNYPINPDLKGATFIPVSNTLEALQRIATFHRHKFTFPVIGITGSNGKTVVKEWLSQLLSSSFKVVRSPKSYNSQIGVPLSVLQIDSSYNLGIFEAGISMMGEMEKLEPIISPQVGIITNIGQPHQENFTNLQQKADQKVLLFKGCKTVIYCADSAQIGEAIENNSQLNNVARFTWGKSPKATVHLIDVKISTSTSTIEVEYADRHFSFSIPFADSASLENAMHCLCTMLYFKIDYEQIAARMLALSPVAMRLELKEGINGCSIINDSYNSDFGSLKIAIDFMLQQKQPSNRILILSDILQSGIEPDVLYSKVAQLIEEKGINKIIGIGPDISAHASLFGVGKEFYLSTSEFLKNFGRRQMSNSVILIKGSRKFSFERIAAVLEQKTHRTTLEINMNALSHNLNYYRSLLKPNVKTMVMVKAFAYGSGSFEVANLLQYQRVDYLGVAFADEGVELREAGITLPIIVMNPSFGTYDLMIEYKLEPEVYSFTGLLEFEKALESADVPNGYPIHIKIDSGMHRLGFTKADIPQLLKALVGNRKIHVSSIFSHLAGSDEIVFDDFTQSQIRVFTEACTSIANALGYVPIRHILNSSGIERFPQAQLDMVRLGIGLYGISAVHQEKLLPVSTLKTRVIQVKQLQPGETVGYGRKGKILRTSTIATIPIGYADGLSRRLGNGAGHVLINGNLAPTIGNICMDTCMVDATGFSVSEGDEVIIFGAELPITDISDSIGTIPYEILTSISRRVKRVYYQE